MDEIVARIKDLSKQYYPNILTDLGVSDDFLRLLSEDIVDRVLIYTNRSQFIPQWMRDREVFSPSDPKNQDFWLRYEHYPIPPLLEKPLARVVVQMAKTVLENNTASGGRVTSATDNGQSVSFGEELQHFFQSQSDIQLFASCIDLLNGFRVPTVVKSTDEHTGRV